jgi:hypothetical protein
VRIQEIDLQPEPQSEQKDDLQEATDPTSTEDSEIAGADLYLYGALALALLLMLAGFIRARRL